MLAAALLIDAVAGEPRWLWSRAPHPAVAMGAAVAWADRTLNRGSARRLRGAVAVLVLVGAAALAGAAITALPLSPLWTTLAAAILLAQRSLADHVADVARDLGLSLPAGRRAVARIVGRDTAGMADADVARAAIESAAENLSDGVIAPALWFAVAGLPGMAAYKMLNTADSMIGHRTPRHEAFGWAAARLDDVANWIPARLTAALILAVQAPPGGRSRAWRAVVADAPRHRSPNAGWPEAAMAQVLGVALSGPRAYGGAMRTFPFVNAGGRRDIGGAEIRLAVTALWRAWAALLAAAVIAALL
jgi:adenosylcobinamide-phosphate synthase